MGGVASAVGGALKMAAPIASMIPGVGTAIGIGSELLGGLAQQNQQKQNARAQQQQYNTALGAVSQPNAYQQMMQQWLGQQQGPQAFNLGTQQGFNTGQDALMQMANRDPAAQMQQAQQFIGMLQPEQQLQGIQQMAALNAGVSGLGQRLGSAQALAQGRLGAQLAAQNNAQNAGIMQQLYSQGQQQQLSAAQGLGQFAQLAQQNAGQNNAQQLAFQQMMQGGYGQLLGAAGQQAGQLTGLQAPQASTAQPFMNSLQTATMLPMLYAQLAKIGQPPNTSGTFVPPATPNLAFTAPRTLFN